MIQVLDFAKNLKKARERAGYTQQEVADHLHISKQAYYTYEKENNGSRPPYEILIELSDFLKTDIDVLLDHKPINKKLEFWASILLVKQYFNIRHIKGFYVLDLTRSKAKKEHLKMSVPENEFIDSCLRIIKNNYDTAMKEVNNRNIIEILGYISEYAINQKKGLAYLKEMTDADDNGLSSKIYLLKQLGMLKKEVEDAVLKKQPKN